MSGEPYLAVRVFQALPKIVNYLNHRHIQASPLTLRLMRRR